MNKYNQTPKELPMRHVFPLLRMAGLFMIAAHASAQDAPGDQDEVFTLGEVQVVGDRVTDATSDDRVSAQEVWKFNADTLTDAVKLVPGVTSNFVSNGRRNEGDISVRGFDRWRVPLEIDGIRVYLPADNRIDFNRFLTPDLGEVQVRKGRVSVLDGPGAMGGMVNLVTRKPTQAFESEFQGGASFDRSGSYDGWSGTAIVGTRQDQWYLQATATELKRDSWTLAKDFQPVQFNTGVTPPPGAEDGGKRNGSASDDWRVSAKAGYTPNNTDEYSLNYTKQSGEKGAPLGVDFFLPTGQFNSPPPQGGNPAGPYQPNSFWTWPYWNVQSGYWLSDTRFGDQTYLKTRLSYSKFDNALFAWDDGNYSSQSANGRFRSYYADTSLGASAEAGTSFIADNTTRAAVFFRRDRHSEYNDNRPTNPDPALHTIEPTQHNEEQTSSLALENTWNIDARDDLIAGISYDRNELQQAEEYGSLAATSPRSCEDGTPKPATCLYDYPLGDSNVFNWQLAVQHHYAADGQVGFSVSARSRFPNNFERFSTRFGTAIPNPDLSPERATHFELNWQAAPVDGAQVSAAIFYTDVHDMIQTVVVTAPNTTQSQNVGDGHNYGAELAGDYRLSRALRVGANYSYLHREIKDAAEPNLEPTGAPNHLGFLWLDWQALASVTVQPSIELAGNLWSDVNGSSTLAYVRTGRYALTNLQVTWQPVPKVEAVLGASNLFDRNFELAPGFPEPGRAFFTKVRVSF